MHTRRKLRRLVGTAGAVAALGALVPALSAVGAPLVPFGVATSSAAAGMSYNTGFSASTTIVVTRVGNWFLVDDTIRVIAGAGCVPIALDNTRVWCGAPTVLGAFRPFRVSAQGGNDTVWNQTDGRMIGNGGPGNDALVGSPTAPDSLDGGSGDDTLNGR